MRVLYTGLAASVLLFVGAATAGAQSGPITCSELPQAAAFVAKLKPGPNTSAAERHLDAARSAKSEARCVAELRKVDHYARRSAEADRRLASHHENAAHEKTTHHQRTVTSAHHVLCADALHQDRPGGSDYHGPPVAGCPRSRI